MDEQYFREHLSAYLDNELTPEERAMMDQHLAENPESRRLLEQMRGLDRLVEEHGGLGGDDYWERSARKIEAKLGIAETEVTELRSVRSMKAGTFWKWVSAAAAVLVLAFIGLHQSDILKRDTNGTVNMTSPDVIRGTRGGTEMRHIDRDNIILDSGEAESAKTGASDQSDQSEPSVKPSEMSISNKPTDQAVQESEKPNVMKIPPSVAAPAEGGAEPGAKKEAPLEKYIDGPGVKAGVSKDRVKSIDNMDVKVQVEPPSAVQAAPRAPRPSDEQQPPSPPAAPKMAPAEAAADDQNYKRSAQSYITTEGDHPAAATVQPTADSRLFGADDVSELVAEELTHWRARRDTLMELSKAPHRQLVLDTLFAPATKDKVLKGLSEQRSNLREEAAGGQKEQIDTLSIGGLQPLLVDAWFNICRLTLDSLEREDGIRYLRSVAGDSTSAETARAQECLKRLGL